MLGEQPPRVSQMPEQFARAQNLTLGAMRKKTDETSDLRRYILLTSLVTSSDEAAD